MPDNKTKKHKHITLDERIEIQECLNHGMTFKATGRRIGKDPTTVSKEVKKHIRIKLTDYKHTDEEGNIITPKQCPILLKSPYVCNPCKRKHYRCPYQKQTYHAREAQKEYEENLIESRTGIPLNKETFWEIDNIISDGINKGQHLYHIMKTNDLGISKSTVYRHLNRGYLSVANIDFPRVVKFKQRKTPHSNYVPKSARIGRTYDDFQQFISENKHSNWCEMDTVIGEIGGKTICTFNFTFCNFMFGLLLDDKSAIEVTGKITLLKTYLADKHLCFGDIFPVIITDNGCEFSNVFSIENSIDCQKETALFFCDPYKSYQKPTVEKNHTLFRDIVPKGRSFNGFSQDTVNLIFSHINGIKRKSLNGKSAYEVFAFTYGATLANLLGISRVPPEDVIQSPKLLLP